MNEYAEKLISELLPEHCAAWEQHQIAAKQIWEAAYKQGFSDGWYGGYASGTKRLRCSDWKDNE